MNKKKATKETINSFMKAVYPEMTELAMTFASEESILRDATEQIAALTKENERLKKLCAELIGDDMKKEIE